MPIYPLLEEAGFDAEATRAIASAFEAVLRELRLTDRTDPLTVLIARRVMELGRHGERDPERLRQQVISELSA